MHLQNFTKNTHLILYDVMRCCFANEGFSAGVIFKDKIKLSVNEVNLLFVISFPFPIYLCIFLEISSQTSENLRESAYLLTGRLESQES